MIHLGIGTNNNTREEHLNKVFDFIEDYELPLISKKAHFITLK